MRIAEKQQILIGPALLKGILCHDFLYFSRPFWPKLHVWSPSFSANVVVRQSSPDTGAAGLTPARLGDWQRLRAAPQQLGQYVALAFKCLALAFKCLALAVQRLTRQLEKFCVQAVLYCPRNTSLTSSAISFRCRASAAIIQSVLVSDHSRYTYCACHGSGMGSFSAVHTLTGAWPRAAIIHISSVPVFII